MWLLCSRAWVNVTLYATLHQTKPHSQATKPPNLFIYLFFLWIDGYVLCCGVCVCVWFICDVSGACEPPPIQYGMYRGSSNFQIISMARCLLDINGEALSVGKRISTQQFRRKGYIEIYTAFILFSWQTYSYTVSARNHWLQWSELIGKTENVCTENKSNQIKTKQMMWWLKRAHGGSAIITDGWMRMGEVVCVCVCLSMMKTKWEKYE